MKELHIKGENICKITEERCKKKTLCKNCEIAINYKKELAENKNI